MADWDEVDKQIMTTFPGSEIQLKRIKQEVNQVFEKYDSDSSGTLTIEEVKAWMGGKIAEWQKER